ncbi:FG-GAP repeat domain-containing protein [Nannocystis bainbridge]|uniref:VCBS repeat-containing protein n=1 Tax=Nannocystis bainbridge TaxID=2995303 RepID=A0ABT5E5C2_9BACT|nr:VCBS repeat-containing protein [Nannocystis bainbridge]MDC0720628.1 VCBS repeat-containing protein [Nannocystis bainbridge]
MALRRRSALRLIALPAFGLLLGLACGPDDACPRASWCGEDGRWSQIVTLVDDAVLVDLDGDGEDEAVVLSREGQKLTLARGTGSHAWRASLDLVERPVALAALPGEVAAALNHPPRIAIFGMDGDGRLVRRRDIPLRDDPMRLDSADLDGDGAPELVVTIPDARRIAVVDPRDGTVREHPAGRQPLDVEVGDVDGDGHRDVVVLDRGADALLVLRGAGDGTLAPAVAHPSTWRGFWLTLADHDGDGDLDAVTRDAQAGVVLFHRNDGHARFSSPIGLSTVSTSPMHLGLAASPSAASGLTSASFPFHEVLTTYVGKGASWLGRVDRKLDGARWIGPGTGGRLLIGSRLHLGRFAWRAGPTPLQVARNSEVKFYHERALATGDLDGDHLLDIAASSGNHVHLFHGRADRDFEPAEPLQLDAPATAIVVADVTGDGRDDIVVDDGDDVRVLIAGADVPFQLGPRVATGIPARALVALRTGADQPPAIAVLAAPKNSGDLEVPGARVIRFGPDGLASATAGIDGLFVDVLVPVDLDADGIDEPLVLGRRDGVPVLAHLIPAGAGFELAAEHDLSGLSDFVPSRWSRLTTADLDGDGDPEVFVGDVSRRWHLDGLADGALVATAADVPAPSHLRDLDGDQRLDAVMYRDRTLAYQRGLGDGTFAPEVLEHEFASGDSVAFPSRPDAQFDLALLEYEGISAHLVREVMRPVRDGESFGLLGAGSELLTGDLDGDGCDDVAILGDGGISWRWGGETDPLTRSDGIYYKGWSRGLAIGDLDGDGAAEVLTADFVNGVDAFSAAQRVERRLDLSLLTTETIESLAVADVDLDGHPDILALHMNETTRLDIAFGAAEPFAFEPWQTVADIPVRALARFQVGDFEGDGDPDVLVNLLENSPVLLRNDGGGAWQPTGVRGQRAFFAPVGDRAELVAQDGAAVYRHDDADLERRVVLHDDIAGWLVQAADVDGDGRYDLTVSEQEGTVAWLLGGDAPVRVPLVDEVALSAVAYPDVDGDGRPDLVALAGGGMLVRQTRRP